MKKHISVLLVLLMALSLAACNKPQSGLSVSDDADTVNTTVADQGGKDEDADQGGEEDGAQDDGGTSEEQTEETEKTRRTRGTTTVKTKRTTATKTMPQGSDVNIVSALEMLTAGKIGANGRVEQDGNEISLPYSDCSIIISGELQGDISLGITFGSNGGVINVVVDGDTANAETFRLPGGYQVRTVCTNLPKGTHTVEISRGTAKNYCYMMVDSIYYTGTLKTPAKKPLQIEFIGDSVTCSEGSIKGGYYSVDGHNSFYGYAAITARNLNADIAVEAICGQKTAGMRGYFNDSSWDFANNQKDIVVVNLGTNDVGWPGSTVSATFKSDVTGLIGDIRAKYGKDTYIVWAYGMMFNNNKSVIKTAVEQYATDNNDARVMFCDMSSVQDTNGYGGHPSATGHARAAAFLTAYLKQHCGV